MRAISAILIWDPIQSLVVEKKKIPRIIITKVAFLAI